MPWDLDIIERWINSVDIALAKACWLYSLLLIYHPRDALYSRLFNVSWNWNLVEEWGGGGGEVVVGHVVYY